MEQLTNPFKPSEKRAKKRLFSQENGIDIVSKLKPAEAEKLLLPKINYYIRQLQRKYQPDKYKDPKEDPQVQVVKEKFEQFINKCSQKEIKEIVIPRFDQVICKAFINYDPLRWEYPDCRRMALACLASNEAMDIIMDYYEQSRAMGRSYKDERILRGHFMGIAGGDLDKLMEDYWPKQLDELLKNPNRNKIVIEKIQAVIKQAGERRRAMNDNEMKERFEDEASERQKRKI